MKPITLFAYVLKKTLLSDVNNRDVVVITYGNFWALADASPILSTISVNFSSDDEF